MEIRIGSDCAEAQPVPSAPANLRVAPGDGVLIVDWDSPTGNFTDFELQHKAQSAADQDATTAGDPDTGWVSQTHERGSIHIRLSGLVNGTAYDVRVRANSAGGPGPPGPEGRGHAAARAGRA